MPESIGARPKVRVNGFSRCDRLAPATVETFEKISKANPPGRREAQPRVLKRDSSGRWRNLNKGSEIVGVVIGGGCPHLGTGGDSSFSEVCVGLTRPDTVAVETTHGA